MPLDEMKRMLRSRKKYIAGLKGRYGLIKDEDHKRMMDFANKITPKNWIIWGKNNYIQRQEKGYLNIRMFIYDGNSVKENLDYGGFAKGYIIL